MHNRKISAVLFVIIAVLGTGQAKAGSHEDEVFAGFEWYCLSNIANTGKIPELFANVGIKPIPEAQAEILLAPQKGQAWLVLTREKKGFSVSLTQQGVCSVTASYADAVTTKELFEKHTKNSKISTQPEGSQTIEIYRVTSFNHYTEKDDIIMVMITTSKLDSVGGIILNALPEKLFNQAK